MIRTMRLGLLTMTATLAVSAAPAAAADYTMFLPGGTPVRAAHCSTGSFMDYTDDACTKSGGEVISADSV